jgi:hypothetical protein
VNNARRQLRYMPRRDCIIPRNESVRRGKVARFCRSHLFEVLVFDCRLVEDCRTGLEKRKFRRKVITAKSMFPGDAHVHDQKHTLSG